MLTGSDASLLARVAALETIVDVLLRDRSDRAVAEADEALPVGIARRIRGMDLMPGLNGSGLFTLIIRDSQGIRRDYLLAPDELAELLRANAETLPAAPAEPDPDGAHLTALARKANAEAERVELENADTRRALNLCDDSPLAGYSVSVDHEARRPGERILRIGFDDGAGRTAVIALPFALALKLNSSIGRAVAERLDAAGGD